MDSRSYVKERSRKAASRAKNKSRMDPFNPTGFSLMINGKQLPRNYKKSQNMRKPRICKYGRSSETGKCIRMRFTAKNKPKGTHTWF